MNPFGGTAGGHPQAGETRQNPQGEFPQAGIVKEEALASIFYRQTLAP